MTAAHIFSTRAWYSAIGRCMSRRTNLPYVKVAGDDECVGGTPAVVGIHRLKPWTECPSHPLAVHGATDVGHRPDAG